MAEVASGSVSRFVVKHVDDEGGERGGRLLGIPR